MSNDARRTEMTWVPLAQVRIAERRRRSLSAATVERYRERLEQGDQAPPVRLVRHGDSFLVRDGRHRVAAAVAAGLALIEAELSRICRTVRAALVAARAAGSIDRSFWGRSTSSASAPAAGSW
jgi:hypothetical protein